MHPSTASARLNGPMADIGWRAMRAALILALTAVTALAGQAQTFVPFQPTWGKFTQAADHSHLNKPLTTADTITVAGAHFVRLGPDLKAGTPDDERVRFFGVNLSHEAAFPPAAKAKDVAATLRSLGFNAVRLHHMDTLPSGDTDQFRSSLTTDPYPTLHSGAMERLKKFIAELRQQGIYINLNLMVGYAFRPTLDGVPALDDKGTAPAYGSPVHVFFPKMVDLQVLHAQRLIAALELKQEPALAQVEIMNESSLAASWLHWNKQHWTDQIRGPYAAELERQWRDWVNKRHGSLAAACQKWGTCSEETGKLLTPAEAETLQHGVQSGLLLKLKQKSTDWLQAAKAQLAPDKGHTTPSATAHPKILDTLRFIADTDKAFFDRMRRVVHDATRSTLPVTGTQVNFGAPLNFDSHASMDYVDAHFYVDHPDFPGGAWSDTDWRIRNESVSGTGLTQMLPIALYRDKRRPFVVSEFNQPYPNRSGQDILPITAAFAAMQNWDGLYFFDYVDGQMERTLPNNFNLQGDWPKTATVGLAARLFRTATVPASQSLTHVQTADSDWFVAAALDRRPDAWERYVGKYRQLTGSDALVARIVNTTVASQDVRLNAAPAFQHRKDDRQVLISAPTAIGVFGELGTSRPLRVDTLSVVPAPGSLPTDTISLMLHSLDGQPLSSARHLLLSVPTRVAGSQVGRQPPQAQQLVPYKGDRSWWTLEPATPAAGQPSSPRRATAPLWLERKTLTVTIKSKAPSLTVYPLGPTGKQGEALTPQALVRQADGYELHLNTLPGQAALWFEITSP